MGEVKLVRDGLPNGSAAGDGCVNEKKVSTMKHPKQLDEVGITESYLRKMAKKEGVSYRTLVQLSMEEWGKHKLGMINKMVAEDIKTR